jgi:uncharacterized protein YqjF (DUF2071 family)
MSAGREVSEPRPFLTARWLYLLMLNFEVPSELLHPLVPRGTDLDDFHGTVLASLVGFRFLDTRVLGVAISGYRDFNEVNLRFYVRRPQPDGSWRRAVVFIKELVPRRAIALVARWWYNEPYSAVPMSHELTLDDPAGSGGGRVAYRWQVNGRWHHVAARIAGPPVLPAPGSEAEFVTEHYWGYTAQRDGGTTEYRVTHPRWRAWTAEAAELECDIGAVYGASFVECLSARPCSAFVAEGSAVEVSHGRRLRDQ